MGRIRWAVIDEGRNPWNSSQVPQQRESTEYWSRNSLTVVTARVFCVVSWFFYFHPQCQVIRHLHFYVICEPRGAHLLMCGSNALHTGHAAPVRLFLLNSSLLFLELWPYGSLHSSVTSQPKTIGHFKAYPKQIEIDFGHFTAYYLLVGVCCPRGLIYVVNLIYFIDLDLIKNCDVV